MKILTSARAWLIRTGQYERLVRCRQRMADFGPRVPHSLVREEKAVNLRVRVNRIPSKVVGATEPEGVDAGDVNQNGLVYLTPPTVGLGRAKSRKNLSCWEKSGISSAMSP